MARIPVIVALGAMWYNPGMRTIEFDTTVNESGQLAIPEGDAPNLPAGTQAHVIVVLPAISPNITAPRMRSTTTRAGELWLAEVEFANGGGSQPRPMLALFSDPNDSVLAVVTSAAPRTPHDLVIHDWQAAGLRRTSTIRLDKLTTMSHGRLWAKLGRLTDLTGSVSFSYGTRKCT